MSRPALVGNRFDVRQLPPNIFAIVMATGIVSLAANAVGFRMAAHVLFGINIVIYPLLLVMLLMRVVAHHREFQSDFTSHAKAPGFFTTVAAPCVLGNQFVILAGRPMVAMLLLGWALVHWLALTYLMLPALITSDHKSKPEQGLSGSWLLIIVGTQAVSVLASLLVPVFGTNPEVIIFGALAFWLIGSMIYLWIISLIFHRIMFLPLAADDLTPPYWINMGAMAIATLAGSRLIGVAGHSELLSELLPFLKGMTLFFWSIATWWIPILLVLGSWRHVFQHTPLIYDHGYWAAVFPLGMYTVCTDSMVDTLHLGYLQVVVRAFVWIALVAWGVTFAGLLHHIFGAMTGEGTGGR